MEIKNKVVLITGASSGIGKETAIQFAKEQAIIVINFRDNHEGAKVTLSEVEKYSQGTCIQADVSSRAEISRLCSEVYRRYGRIDILINNAAVPSERSSFLETDQQTMENIVTVNLLGPILVSQTVIPYMQQQGEGKILFTGSIRGAEGGGRTIVYSAAKAGIHNVTKTLAKELAPHIQVNAVAPGYLKTKFHADIDADKEAKFLDQTYLKRAIREQEIAEGFVFLAKNDAITGQVLYIDGGYTLK